MRGNATVIFDFDGTIANSLDLLFKLYNEHATHFGYLPLEISEFSELRKLGYKKSMKKKGIKVRMLPKMIVTIGREMRARMEEVKPYPGVKEVIDELHSKGFSVGVLTSNQAPLVNEFLRTHGFAELDFVVSEKTLFGKDKALRKIINRLELDVDQVLYVGDEPRDVTACRKVGVPIVGVSWGLAGKEGFEAEPPDVLVETSDELLKTIIGLSQE